MSICQTAIESEDEVGISRFAARHRVLVSMSDEVIAAVDGWRAAHGLTEQSEALGELVRLGLMSEIAKIYRLVNEDRTPPAPKSPAKRKTKRKWASETERGEDERFSPSA